MANYSRTFRNSIKQVIFSLILTAPGTLLGQASHSVTLQWAWQQGNGGAATGFNVKRGTTSGGPYTQVGAVGSSTTVVFTDSGPFVEGQTYYYVVTAVGPQGESAPSNEASATIPTSNPTGLIGYWTFDEGSGTVAHDTSGSGYNGTVTGATWTTGKINGGLSFNGTTNSVITPGIALGSTFSVSVWANPAVTAQVGYSRILETQFSGGLYLGVDVSGTKFKFIVNAAAGATGNCGSAYGCAEGGTITSGWHLVTGTYDGATAKLYVDGAVVASDTFTAPPNANYPLYVARYYLTNGYGWNGVLDEVRLYNRALSAAEVAALYTGPPDTTPPTTPGNVQATAVSGTQINVTWAASSDNVGVAGYRVYRNGNQVGSTTTTLTYSDTGLTPSTQYSYTVVAFDAAGNVSSPSSPASATTLPSDTIPPAVSITAPAMNATVSNSVTVTAAASDNVAVHDVQFQLDGVNLGADLTSAPYSFSWNTTTASNGTHNLTAIATDTSNNRTTSASVTVTVNNGVSGPPTQGLIGYWNFDEGSGSVAHDTSGSGYNGTMTGAAWTTGKINSGLSFNGTTSAVVTSGIALGSRFSVSVWTNPAATTQAVYGRILETQYNGGLYLGADGSGTKYKFIVNTGSGATGACGSAYGCAEGGTIAAGWHLVTATYDGAAARLYIDGAQVASETFTAPGNTNYPLYVGRYYGSNGYGWNGALDEVRLYNRALTAAEVQAIYSGGGAQSLIGYWPFDEGSGAVAHDTSGSGHDGAITAAAWIAGDKNTALSFNGSTSSVVTSAIALAGAFTVSAWVNPSGGETAYGRIAETQYNVGLYLGLNSSGSKYKWIVNSGLGATGNCGLPYGCAEGGTVTSGWHLVTGTFDGATARLYVDGTLAASETFTAPSSTTLPLYIGRYYGAAGYGFTGGIDEVRLYNRALSAAEVATLFSGQ